MMSRQTSKPRQNRRAARAINSATFQFLEPRLLFAGQTWNVASFGADLGDNGHNDSPAISAAMNAASAGDTIYFPAGTYNLNSFSGSNQGLVLKNGLTYIGDFN